ncbi:MAG: HIT domain-containing protein [Alphaproteobacteria bacterium]|nr:HIT domain-containing protein [Alphaproteobacteria bacterium]
MGSFQLDSKLNHDTHFVSDLDLCRLLIMNDSNYPWFILVPRRLNITEIYQLSNEDRFELDYETNFISEILASIFKDDKMNIAPLVNIVSQLHVHIIVRKKTDLLWPETIWGKKSPLFYSKEDIENTISNIKNLLTNYK